MNIHSMTLVELYNFAKKIGLDIPPRHSCDDIDTVTTINNQLPTGCKVITYMHSDNAGNTWIMYRFKFDNEIIRTWFQLKYPMTGDQ